MLLVGRLVRGASFLSLLAATHSFCAGIVINEIHYNPDVKTDRAEFIELFNPGPEAVNFSGWVLTNAVSFSFSNGTILSPGSYLVIAQDPPTIFKKFGVQALGPWTGSLNNSGDDIVLLNSAGGIENKVSYQLGFPWPTVGSPPGYSIELVNPAFDNDVGGNWRASVAGNPLQESRVLVSDHSSWSYFKGRSEASSPSTAWRNLSFDDASWSMGPAPIGYDPGLSIGTPFDDMRGNYTSFFLRQTFQVDNPTKITSLILEALYDDGFKLWINGVNVLNQSLGADEVPFDATASGAARESNNYDTFNLDNPSAYLRQGSNVIAVQVHNVSLDNSSDAFFDCRLLAQTGPSLRGPTPGRLNSVFATNLPPQIRQVDHTPQEPHGGMPVLISAKITDPEGVVDVALQYQIVDPGSYIALSDSAYTNNWTTLAMKDDGTGGDEQAGDNVYSVFVPASVQQHRRLIRYRITAVDKTGLSVAVPYADDPEPNFAYFCYDGVPAWQAAVRPGSTPVLNFTTNVMGRLPVVHLISKKADVENSTWFSRYSGDAYPWTGTLIFDGKVYDHIHFRTRGGVWRYAMVKNMWKFDLNSGHELEMKDDYARNYKTKWSKLNLGASIQQGDYQHRGEQGMFESVGFRLFNLAGTEACNTTFLQFRVIDKPEEAPSGTQFEGDFWGVYLAVEQEDGRFLDEHNLPDGNFYKMDGGSGELNNTGPFGPTDKSDLNSFLTYTATTPPEAWWTTNLDLNRYYGYRTIVEAIHHYDIDESAGKNYFYYLNPLEHRWSVHSWDLDLTWADNMYGGGNEPFRDRVLPRSNFNLAYKNRIREIRDLLYNTDQAWQLIDECARLLRGPTNSPTILDADRCQWDYNPKMTSSTYSEHVEKAGQGRFYQWPNEPGVSKNFDGCVQLMKNYVVSRASFLDNRAVDQAIPVRPALTFVGATNYSINQLSFRVSSYQGANPFAALQWRIAEVTDSNAPAYKPESPVSYEINPAWQSEELTAFTNECTIPAGVAKVGHAYRVRARMKDTTGRWSRWSTPMQFVAGLPENAEAVVDNLRLSELMYYPSGNSDYEFIELHNTSEALELDLQGLKFTAGIDFTFTNSTTVAPGSYLLVIKATDPAPFRAHYGLDASVPVVGPYTGSLANGGEQLTLKTGAGGTEVFSFKFGDGRGWPLSAKGAGHSLVPLDRARNGQSSGALDYPGNWRASTYIGGSPGVADPEPPPPTILLNELAANTQYSDPLYPEYDSNDWIELYNATPTNSILSKLYLSDDPLVPDKWPVTPVEIPSHGWVSFDEVTGFHNPLTNGFGLDKAGEGVLLSHIPDNGPARVLDAIEFKAQARDVSLGRYPDGAGYWYPMLRTRDAMNSAPAGGVVINEIMYHPPDLATNDNTRDEYVELFNPTTKVVVLQDTNGAWRLDGSIGFTFPTNTSMGPGEVLVVVNFDPADAAAVETFRQTYQITNSPLSIFGPYSGKLGNRSDRVALERPQSPDILGDPYSWIIVDEVIYGNQDPWPTSANGPGNALKRNFVTLTGMDPSNWIAAIPTPGSAGLPTQDRDGDGLPDSWETQYGLNPDDPLDAGLDTDKDGISNLDEFRSGTNPTDPTSALRFDGVSLIAGAPVLRFTAVAQRSYTIQFRTDAGTGGWQKLSDVAAGSETRVVEISDPTTATSGARFYRLVTPPIP